MAEELEGAAAQGTGTPPTAGEGGKPPRKRLLEAAKANAAANPNMDDEAKAEAESSAEGAPAEAGSSAAASGSGNAAASSSSSDSSAPSAPAGSGGSSNSGGSSAPSQPAHVHSWVAVTSQQWHSNPVSVWVQDTAAWDEPVYRVVLTSEDFLKYCEMEEDCALLTMALERLEAQGDEPGKPFAQVCDDLGISRADIEAAGDVEFT